MASLYDRLYSAHQKCYEGSLSKKAIQIKCNEEWGKLKASYTDSTNLKNATEQLIKQLNEKGTRKSAAFFNYFSQVKLFVFFVLS